MSEYTFPNNQPVVLLNCESAFDTLNSKEKLYAHYLSKASWYGGLIVLIQTSAESPLIYCLLQKLFHAQSVEELKRLAVKELSFTEDEITALLVYASGIFYNMGNYKGSGDKKFIPNLSKEKLEALIKSSNAFKLEPEKIQSLLSHCLEAMYSLKDNEKQLGFPFVGTTTYLSKNFTKEDQEIVKGFFKQQGIEPYNSRLFKTVDSSGHSCYEIRLASVLQTEDEEEKSLISSHTVNGHKFIITRGDYSKLLQQVNKNLALAKEYAANENQAQMLEFYSQSFQTGSLTAHKDGSRHWIKDKSPIVESYIGFIETYRDPAGMRGEFEGFVAVVNKTMSAKLLELVKAASDFLPLLPWPSTYEKDKFLQPDFTSLDVLTFACSNIPCGICIPNYDEIRQSEGFKNVSLGNVIPLYNTGPPNYLSKSDQDLCEKYNVKAFDVQVALHELLGHGSGKLFRKETNENFNFNVDEVRNLETNEKISSWYEEGDTYDSIFGPMSSSYEECRAECVGLYLCTDPEVLRIFGYVGAEAEEIMYTNWLSYCQKGLESLQMYEPQTESWLQVCSVCRHMPQARYVILQVLLEGGGDFVKIEKLKGADGNPDLLVTMDRSRLLTVGKPVIGNFLKRLQLYRATADAKSAKTMYDKYSAVTSEDRCPFLHHREIVMARKRPRIMFVLANTILKDGKVHLKNYDSTLEGMIQSWVDRFQELDVTSILEEMWEKDKPHFL
ncbi:dipeptidyl peptidase 3-like [Uloborus diversus]|uniref:dipeptidyl peptidase 3-like n=1 Tax=Uloborus diversus TaxID=327109 RepID=UPI00240A7EDE|nr:dipeptidyl peptidase 3-like [Uloborus diversus]